MATIPDDITKLQLLQATQILRAYLECSDEVQTSIRELLDIINDPETDEDDREMTLFTLADALFPNPHDGKLGMDLEESERLGASQSEATRQVLEELDQEEEAFAERLRTLMEQRGLNQESLAEKAGVGQPAISNMLNRRCRPQRRTVLRFAEALEVSPEDLWPQFVRE